MERTAETKNKEVEVLATMTPEVLDLLKSMKVIMHGYRRLEEGTIGNRVAEKFDSIMNKVEAK